MRSDGGGSTADKGNTSIRGRTASWISKGKKIPRGNFRGPLNHLS